MSGAVAVRQARSLMADESVSAVIEAAFFDKAFLNRGKL
jgi:hypothetical protein